MLRVRAVRLHFDKFCTSRGRALSAVSLGYPCEASRTFMYYAAIPCKYPMIDRPTTGSVSKESRNLSDEQACVNGPLEATAIKKQFNGFINDQSFIRTMSLLIRLRPHTKGLTVCAVSPIDHRHHRMRADRRVHSLSSFRDSGKSVMARKSTKNHRGESCGLLPEHAFLHPVIGSKACPDGG